VARIQAVGAPVEELFGTLLRYPVLSAYRYSVSRLRPGRSAFLHCHRFFPGELIGCAIALDNLLPQAIRELASRGQPRDQIGKHSQTICDCYQFIPFWNQHDDAFH